MALAEVVTAFIVKGLTHHDGVSKE